MPTASVTGKNDTVLEDWRPEDRPLWIGAPQPRLGRTRRLAKAGARVARRAASSAADLSNKLPSGVREQIRQSAKEFTKVRSLKGAKSTLIAETERLFLVVTPMLAAVPLPLTGAQARIAAGCAAGAGAAVEQAQELADLVSWGGALPTAPVAFGAMFTAWVVHLWIALSARVNQLKAAGREVDGDLLGQELARAYLGDKADRHTNVIRGVATKAVEGWLMGLVPGAGIAYDAYTAQRTVVRILREPVTAHPPAVI